MQGRQKLLIFEEGQAGGVILINCVYGGSGNGSQELGESQ
jgi:hypothetical protein